MKDLRNDKPNHDSFINEIEGHCLKCISRNKRKDKYARHHPVLWGICCNVFVIEQCNNKI